MNPQDPTQRMQEITEQPEDLRAAVMQLKLLGLPLTSYMGSETLVEDILRLCEAAALAALPEKKTKDVKDYINIGWNQAIATAQANIHSVFGGTK